MEVVMRLFAIVVSALALVGIARLAGAEEVERYRLEKTDTGYVRMDTATGEMSLCEERSGQLVCKLAADERAAFQGDIDRLQARLEEMEGRVAKLEARPSIPETLLPSDEQVDKGIDIMEKFFRSFMGIVKELDKDTAKPDADPQRT
jgi:hypothetical protein